jgi:hypothetical protein
MTIFSRLSTKKEAVRCLKADCKKKGAKYEKGGYKM